MSMTGRGMSGGGKLGMGLLVATAVGLAVASDDFQDAVKRVTGEPTILRIDSGENTFKGVGNTILNSVFEQ